MRKMSIGILAVISYLSLVVSFFWAIIEFILYLVKDREFNWWSVWLILISLVSLITFGLMSLYGKNKKVKNITNNSVKKRSAFQERLDYMAKNH